MTADTSMQAIDLAALLIREEEGIHLHAYPDPRSALGKAIGAAGINHMGRTGQFPREGLSGFNGAPWTIGFGATGQGIRHGTKWTRQQAEDRLAHDLVAFQQDSRRTWPGADKLHPAAQAALISLAYNRGTDLRQKPGDTLDRRREMRQLVGAVAAQDYARMAQLFYAMRRIWAGERMGGLLKRREREAQLCLQAHAETTTKGA